MNVGVRAVMHAFEGFGKACSFAEFAAFLGRRGEFLLRNLMAFLDAEFFMQGAWVLDRVGDPVLGGHSRGLMADVRIVIDPGAFGRRWGASAPRECSHRPGSFAQRRMCFGIFAMQQVRLQRFRVARVIVFLDEFAHERFPLRSISAFCATCTGFFTAPQETR